MSLDNKIDIPIALLTGTEDKLANIQDVRWLKQTIEKNGKLVKYEEYKFGHLAFLLPIDLKIY